MSSNKEIAQKVLELTGGKENVNNAWHCVTRLRFNLNDKDKVQLDAIKDVPGVMGAQFSGDQFQVIVGNKVSDVYEELEKELGGSASSEPTESDNNEGIVSKLMDVISGIFSPILPALAGTGLLKGFLALFVALGWLSDASGTYQVLFLISDIVFYFLPFLLAVSAAKKFKTSEFLSLTVAGGLMYPTLLNAAGTDAVPMNLFGLIDVPNINYSSSVVPIILGVWLLSYIDRWVRSWMPSVISMMFSPLLSLTFTIPITLVFLGPLGNYIGNGLAGVINWLFANTGPFAGLVLGGLMALIIMTGMHYAFTPLVVGNLATLGFDTTVIPVMFVSNIAQSGAAFAVAVKSKDKNMKQLALSSGISALFGVTEPAMYGVNLKLKKPFYAAMAGGGLAGAFVVFMAVRAYGTGVPGLPMIPVFIDSQDAWNVIYLLIGIVIAFATAFIVTFLLGFEETITAPVKSATVENKPEAKATAVVEANNENKKPADVFATVTGQIVPLKDVPDETFAGEIMGKGIAIKPTSNQLVSPVAGEITVFPSSHHAIGIKADSGLEVLIHIGIDTVELKGKHFSPKMKVGDRVEVGDLLVVADVAAIEEAGYNTATMVIITNTFDYLDVVPINNEGEIFEKEQLLSVIS
ncbi:beta-glucoside-specific PTS transporter subunit IIABC [Marinilactibacillus sp. Marseille-P9653]|uniref:beta-glucoside-specific PTS transporter subunit IIABC n=1 Tax=Marinilactibacillus sp. Marseille-P9653 TaxID=2866583 RepID=UPI001CE48D87|nr:beta-glucoside-specific PTS transporter subunit IIABC [Marinilactibacillus sp. Marseille-P9653]